MEGKVTEILLSAEQLQRRVKELGAQISDDYRGRRLVLVCILKGAVVFFADLMRAITIPVQVDFMAVSSYGSGTSTSGVVRIQKDLDHAIEGKDVLIVEDIVDTGLTLRYLTDVLRRRNPASLKVAVLLDKPERRKVDISADYVGFSIPDRFVVGYGLDYAEHYRHLPYVGVLGSAAVPDGAAREDGGGEGEARG